MFIKKLASLFISLLLLNACAQKNIAKEKVEKNQPKFSSSHSFENSIKEVKSAAEKVLQNYLENNQNPMSDAAKIEKEMNKISVGWVYSEAKDKYIEYKMNGFPKRKTLKVRRKYSFSLNPSLAGTDVEIIIQEELENIDLKTGEFKNWKSVKPDSTQYQKLLLELIDEVRAL